MDKPRAKPPDERVPPRPPIYRFDDFEVDTGRCQLRRDGEVVNIRNQTFDLLVVLLGSGGELVGRDRIRDVLWHGISVDFDTGINSIVRDLRRTLGDDARNPRYIETLPGRGYRFVADVAEVVRTTPPVPVDLEYRPRFPTRTVFTATTVLLLLVGWSLIRWPGVFRNADSQTILILPLEVPDSMPSSGDLGRSVAEAAAVTLSGAQGLRVLAVPDLDEMEPGGTYATLDRVRAMGAGRLLTGSIQDGRPGLRIDFQLLETETRQLLWATQKQVQRSDIPLMIAIVADSIVGALGCSFPRRYEYFRYVRGSENMTGSPELDAVTAAFALDPPGNPDLMHATEILVSTYPDEPAAHLIRLHALVEFFNWDMSAASADGIRAGLDALEKVDPDDPNISILRALNPEAFDSAHFTSDAGTLIEGCLARSDLTPAMRSFALRTSARFLLHVEANTVAAAARLEEASALDPADSWTFWYLADTYYRMGRMEAGLHAARIAVALEPANYTYEMLARALGSTGRWPDAARLLGEFYADHQEQRTAGWYAFALHQAGIADQAYRIACEAEAISTPTRDETVAGAIPLAAYWYLRGEPALAAEHLQRLCAQNAAELVAHVGRMAPGILEAPACRRVIECCAAN